MLTIPPFDQARVLVVGDVMLDRYISGWVARISPEAMPEIPTSRRRHVSATTRDDCTVSEEINIAPNYWALLVVVVVHEAGVPTEIQAPAASA